MRLAVTWLCLVPVAAALIASSYLHLENTYQYLSAVYSYELVGRWAGVAAAAVLPQLQLAVGLAMLLDLGMRRAAFAIATLLMAGYAAAQLSVLARGLEIACGCFGNATSAPINAWSVSVPAGCAMASVVGLWATRPAAALTGNALPPDL